MDGKLLLVLMTLSLSSRQTLIELEQNQTNIRNNATQLQFLRIPSLHVLFCFSLQSFLLKSNKNKTTGAAALQSRIHLFMSFSHYQTILPKHMQWGDTHSFHFNLSREENHRAEQERLNSTEQKKIKNKKITF